jgi:hypothetical protein
MPAMSIVTQLTGGERVGGGHTRAKVNCDNLILNMRRAGVLRMKT